MATVRNLVIERSAAFSVSVVISDLTDDPLDLTSYTYLGQMRRSHYSSTAIDFAVSSPDPTLGTLVLELTSEQTAALKPGRYVYDVVIVDVNNQGTRVLEGIAVINPDVTRIPAPTTTTTTA